MSDKKRVIMLGNEAIARGAYEAGVKVSAAYPGTPSTEISEYLVQYKDDLYCEWSPNEKVATEVAVGASLAGTRAMACMKHVGFNVAADPAYSVSYMGVNGGLVIVVADDPGLYSSQNEQDTRMVARAAQLPVLEPSDSSEAKEFMKQAFELSEKFDRPFVFRTTTRLAHSQGIVELEAREEIEDKPYEKDIRRTVMMPANAKQRHVEIEKRNLELAEAANTLPINKVEMKDTKIGVITSGIPVCKRSAAYGFCPEAWNGESASEEVDRRVCVKGREALHHRRVRSGHRRAGEILGNRSGRKRALYRAGGIQREYDP